MPALSKDVHPSYLQSAVAAASGRAPLRGELLPITVTTTSKTFAVPASWKGSHVRMQADGGDLYLQISTDANTAAVVDKDARAQESGNPIALLPSVSGNGAYKIPADTFVDVPFPAGAVTFALQGSTACVCRTHPSET